MAIECERKFLVNTKLWQPQTDGLKLSQGYLSQNPERIVRVRIAGRKAFLTVKGKNEGICRAEFEYSIPLSDAQAMLTLCTKPLVEKIRYREIFAGQTWEIDCFIGVNAGLVVAEIELCKANQEVILPPWVTREESDDSRYYNSNLIAKPYSLWGKT